ncbi:hypothetical protein CLV90_1112 [Maribacter spongiicola]|uniref:Uncharacterized protein n=1 Tax=Maribacter spongiicola TaxID=1206753 RepID=A0A4R7K8M2_9FLAO|nr:hypothetical protein [Maribacter spongiicola]TDT47042.1 hypothetical protein CLV90_1112 [Maribacter spongiicola]
MRSTDYKQEILISTELPESLMVLIIKYWAFENDDFKYNLLDFIDFNPFEESNETLDKILINSKCLITLNSCQLCNSYIKYTAKNREDYYELIRLNHKVCIHCKEFSVNYNNKSINYKTVEIALKELSETELKVLVGIVQLKSKTLIYRHIFNNDLEDSNIWGIINVLQRKKLISIDRDDNWKIKNFNYNQKLKKLI